MAPPIRRRRVQAAQPHALARGRPVRPRHGHPPLAAPAPAAAAARGARAARRGRRHGPGARRDQLRAAPAQLPLPADDAAVQGGRVARLGQEGADEPARDDVDGRARAVLREPRGPLRMLLLRSSGMSSSGEAGGDGDAGELAAGPPRARRAGRGRGLDGGGREAPRAARAREPRVPRVGDGGGARAVHEVRRVALALPALGLAALPLVVVVLALSLLLLLRGIVGEVSPRRRRRRHRVVDVGEVGRGGRGRRWVVVDDGGGQGEAQQVAELAAQRGEEVAHAVLGPPLLLAPVRLLVGAAVVLLAAVLVAVVAVAVVPAAAAAVCVRLVVGLVARLLVLEGGSAQRRRRACAFGGLRGFRVLGKPVWFPCRLVFPVLVAGRPVGLLFSHSSCGFCLLLPSSLFLFHSLLPRFFVSPLLLRPDDAEERVRGCCSTLGTNWRGLWPGWWDR